MTIEVRCPAGHVFAVEDTKVGSATICIECGRSVHVPEVGMEDGERSVNATQREDSGSFVPPTSEPTLDQTINATGSEHLPITDPSALKSYSSRQIPVKFGRYRVVKMLGQGNMGTVYLTKDTHLDRKVALKVPHFGPDDGPATLERFYREARAAATLHHPNLCPVHDVGMIEGIHFLTMAYLQGETLTYYIKHHKSLDQRRVVQLALTIARALAEAHKHGVVHRDLKPSNVMIDGRGEPIIMDFGLARRTGAEDTRLTTPGSILGSPSYMAPEQASGEVDKMGPSCDIYSLGVIIYEMLTGQPPFVGSLGEILAKITRDKPVPPTKQRSGLDAAFDAICLKALAKKPEDRFESMEAMAEQLQDLHDKLNRPGHHAPLVLGAVAAVAIVLGAIGVQLLPKGSMQPPSNVVLDPSPVIRNESGVPPAPLPENFDANEAKAAQQAWAEYLKTQPFLENSIGMKLALIPPGSFMMGAPANELERIENELPQHPVKITRPFYIGVHEVTQAQYQSIRNQNPSRFAANPAEADRYPVEMIRDTDAEFFCRDLTRREQQSTGIRYRLPTESEWEYACRAGTRTATYFGNSLSGKQANFNGDYPYGGADPWLRLERTTAVGTYAPNAFGLYDMHGNVWEWCSDWYAADAYKDSPVEDPKGPITGLFRVLRGGSWENIGRICRSASRADSKPRNNGVKGFRVVGELPSP